jgi:7-keto-8-aminopelargonate synthetase-like enzyme
LSKAFGVYGGAILGTTELRRKIFARSRSFVGSTPLPLPLANAASQSVKILSAGGRGLRRRLNQKSVYVKTSLRKAGFEIPKMPGPIIPIHAKTELETRALKKHLLTAGIYPPFLKYPGGGANGYFRFVISSGHTRVQLNQLCGALAAWRGGSRTV